MIRITEKIKYADFLRLMDANLDGKLTYPEVAKLISTFDKFSLKNGSYDDRVDLLQRLHSSFGRLHDLMVTAVMGHLDFIMEERMMNEQISSKSELTSQIEESLLTIREVCETYKVSRQTVNNWFKKGLTKYEVGGSVRIKKKDLLSFIAVKK